MLLFLLTGCSTSSDPMEVGLQLRSRILQAEACSFNAKIFADYGDQLHSFSMECRADPQGNVAFTLSEPDTIRGIVGKLSGEGGTLTFDDTELYFPLLAEEKLSPVSAPWLLMKTLRSGYLSSACDGEGGIRLSMDDSYEEDPLRLDVWLNGEGMPEKADILYDGRRILSVAVEKFEIL